MDAKAEKNMNRVNILKKTLPEKIKTFFFEIKLC